MGSGGGGGAYNLLTNYSVSSGQVYNINIGSGGTVSSDANGGAGGSSTFTGPQPGSTVLLLLMEVAVVGDDKVHKVLQEREELTMEASVEKEIPLTPVAVAVVAEIMAMAELLQVVRVALTVLHMLVVLAVQVEDWKWRKWKFGCNSRWWRWRWTIRSIF